MKERGREGGREQASDCSLSKQGPHPNPYFAAQQLCEARRACEINQACVRFAAVAAPIAAAFHCNERACLCVLPRLWQNAHAYARLRGGGGAGEAPPERAPALSTSIARSWEGRGPRACGDGGAGGADSVCVCAGHEPPCRIGRRTGSRGESRETRRCAGGPGRGGPTPDSRCPASIGPV